MCRFINKQKYKTFEKVHMRVFYGNKAIIEIQLLKTNEKLQSQCLLINI